MNLNPIIEISPYIARMATTFIPDITDPYLMSYTLDISREILVLNFSETINADSFLLMKFTFNLLSMEVQYFN